MGRNRKIGLEYFPMDVDFFQDLRIRKLIKYQGGKAVAVYTLLLCIIYKQGYYVRWDEELPFIISEQTGFEEAYIREVLKCCMVVGLFSKELYDSEKVITSRSIQERYKGICEQLRRVCLFDEFALISSGKTAISSEEIGISSEETGISSAKKPINSEKIPQKKKKIKGNKENSTIVESKKVAACAAAPIEARMESFKNSLVPFVRIYGRDMMNDFYSYWTEPNKSHTKMRFELERTWDVKRRLNTWAARDKNFNNRDNGRGTNNSGSTPESRAADTASRIAQLLEEDGQ